MVKNNLNCDRYFLLFKTTYIYEVLLPAFLRKHTCQLTLFCYQNNSHITFNILTRQFNMLSFICELFRWQKIHKMESMRIYLLVKFQEICSTFFDFEILKNKLTVPFSSDLKDFTLLLYYKKYCHIQAVIAISM